MTNWDWLVAWIKQEKHLIPSFRFQAYHLHYWAPVAQAGTRKQHHNRNGEQGLKPEWGRCTYAGFQHSLQLFLWEPSRTVWGTDYFLCFQSLSARSPTKNTLAFGFYITPHCDSQKGIHSPEHSKPKQQALDNFRLPRLEAQVSTTDAASQGSLLLTQRTRNGSFEKG